MTLRPGPLGGQSSEPQLNQRDRGYPVVGQCSGQRPRASSALHLFPRGNGSHPKITLIMSCFPFL